MAEILKTASTIAEDMKKLEFSYIADGNSKCYSHARKHFGSLL